MATSVQPPLYRLVDAKRHTQDNKMDIINKQVELKGDIISPGIVIAPVCHYQVGSNEQTAIFKIAAASVDKEINRFEKALQESKDDIIEMARSIERTIGKEEAQILESHILLLEDKQLLNKIYSCVREDRYNIEYAVKSTFEEYEEIFRSMEDEYMKDRALDFYELKKKIISHLTGTAGQYQCGVNCNTLDKDYDRAILANELTISIISSIEKEKIVGFVTKDEGKNSHIAILTRSASIPYITGIDAIGKIGCGSLVIIDADEGKVIANPTREVLDHYRELIEEKKKSGKCCKETGPTALTKSETEIKLFANAISMDDVMHVEDFSFSGIGLVRTEFFYYNAKEFPGEEEQTALYSTILKKTAGREVTFRLFDFGGDKQIRSIKFLPEENPLLGLRGIRFLMRHQDILKSQVRALCKSAAQSGPLRIMYPMISSLNELLEVNDLVKKIIKEEGVEDRVELGMMFEVPSVFIDPEPFYEHIDFISIGTNDLVQYLFGVDRNNVHVNYLNNQNDPAVLKLLDRTIKSADKAGIDVSVCGEIDYTTDFLDNLIKSGLRKISIFPLGIKKAIGKINEVED